MKRLSFTTDLFLSQLICAQGEWVSLPQSLRGFEV